jgi:4-diphosphocytidyl-2C-methyl-D-erythritol kinase
MGALMSGSGPSVFAIFSDENTAKKAAEYLIESGVRAKVCKTI